MSLDYIQDYLSLATARRDNIYAVTKKSYYKLGFLIKFSGAV